MGEAGRDGQGVERDGQGVGSLALSPASPADPWARFETGAAILFLVLAAIALIAGLLVASELASTGASPVVTWALALLGTASAAVLWAGWYGLQGPRDWGRTAAVWLLAWIAVSGFAGAAADLTESKLTIPVAAIAAAYILSARPALNPRASQRAIRIGATIGVAAVVVTLLPAGVLWAATGPALTAASDDLDMRMEVECLGEAGRMPEQIEVALSWTWRRTDLLVMGPDSVGIGWVTAEADEDGSGRYSMRSASDDEPYLTPGHAGDAGAILEERLRDTHSWTWAVNTAHGGLRDGTVRVTLEAALPDVALRPAHGVLFLEYAYAHLDRWVVEDGARCEW